MAATFVSKTVFMAGLIIAILVSSGVSAVISSQSVQGPQARALLLAIIALRT